VILYEIGAKKRQFSAKEAKNNEQGLILRAVKGQRGIKLSIWRGKEREKKNPREKEVKVR